jgi:hypothetical protein
MVKLSCSERLFKDILPLDNSEIKASISFFSKQIASVLLGAIIPKIFLSSID